MERNIMAETPKIIGKEILNDKGDGLKLSQLKDSFARILAEEFRKEFSVIFLSRQLYNSIRVFVDEDGRYHVTIPAQVYDIDFYRKRGIIKHTGTEGYSVAVNVTGGFSTRHKDYVARCIDRTINRWAGENGIKTMNVNMSGGI